MLKKCMLLVYLIITPGVVYASIPWSYLILWPPPIPDPPPSLDTIWFPSLDTLPSGEIVAISGSDTNATAYNNGPHAVWTCWQGTEPPYQFYYAYTYHSYDEDAGLWRGYIGMDWLWNGEGLSDGPVQIDEYVNVAFPTIATIPTGFHDAAGHNVVCGAVAYLTGEVTLQEYPSAGISIIEGDKIRVRVFRWDGPEMGDRIDIDTGHKVGIPSILYLYQYQISEHLSEYYLLVTFADYRDKFGDIVIWRLKVTVDENGYPHVDREKDVELYAKVWESGDVGAGERLYVYRPSTAVPASIHTSPPPTIGDKKLPFQLHTIWGWKNGIWGMGYAITTKDAMGNIIVKKVESLEPHTGPHRRDNQSPYIWSEGRIDSLRLVFAQKLIGVGYDREILYRARFPYYKEDEGDVPKPLHRWNPPIYDDPNNPSDDNYHVPDTISTWYEGDNPHNSINLDSRYPQGSANSILWTEEAPNSQIYTYAWDNVGDPVYRGPVSPPFSPGPDSYPQISNTVRFNTQYVDGEWYIVWTGPNPEYTPGSPQPRYLVYRQILRPNLSSYQMATQSSGDTIKILPATPVYCNIVCGESIPSFFCEKRDSIIVADGHKIDAGEELAYKFIGLKPWLHYLIGVKVWAPTPVSEVFQFDGEETDTLFLDPVKSQTYACILPESLYADGVIDVKIQGPNGAFLEEMRVYQIDIMEEDSTIAPQGITAPHPLPRPSLSVRPTVGKGIEIKYSVPGKEPVSLEVYNTTGRLVEVLTEPHSLKPGVYTLFWNPREDREKVLPSGIYFVRLKVGACILTRKTVIIR